ncbi:MAG TPA: 3-oxoacyl-[acyl-carrier-protein] synthase III C-terminal domain-containing protein, partial [Bacteroidales bacterium]|nr:3-oxoacyl-[acyl-carrier-protein] synthase III C-terminal domain-containing protein [Bacteroidales bacterium]
FALKEVIPNINLLLAEYSLPMDEVDYFVFHQANLLINESIRKKMKLPAEKTPNSMDRFGNTSSASIPLTIVSELRNCLQSNNKKIILSGFGVGLSWGSVYFETQGLFCSELIEI